MHTVVHNRCAVDIAVQKRHAERQHPHVTKKLQVNWHEFQVEGDVDEHSERGHTNEGKETARLQTPEPLHNKRTSIQEDPSVFESARTKKTDVLSTLRYGTRKGEALLLHAHSRRVRLDRSQDRLWSERNSCSSGEVRVVPNREATRSGTPYSSAAGKQTEDVVNDGQRCIRVVDDHGTESWAKFTMCRGLGQDRTLGSGSRLVTSGHQVCLEQ